MLMREPDDVTGQSHESTQKKEAIAKTRQQLSPADSSNDVLRRLSLREIELDLMEAEA